MTTSSTFLITWISLDSKTSIHSAKDWSTNACNLKSIGCRSILPLVALETSKRSWIRLESLFVYFSNWFKYSVLVVSSACVFLSKIT